MISVSRKLRAVHIQDKSELQCGGQDHGEDGAGKPGEDTIEGAVCEEVQPDNVCFEDCLRKIWEDEDGRPGYSLFFSGVNCQEYDNEARSICRSRCGL